MSGCISERVTVINVMSNEQLLRLKKRGAYHIDLGIESGCDATLRRMNKGVTVKDAYRAVFRLFKLGFSVGTYFIVGTPFESRAEAFETFRFIDRLPGSVEKGVNCYTPYPLTDFYPQAIQEGFTPPDSLEGWGHHTIQNRLPPDPEVRAKYLSYHPRKPVLSVQRLKRAAQHMGRIING